MTKLVNQFTIILLLVFATSAWAEQSKTAVFTEGKDYKLVKPAQQTTDPDKIEVIEFFWYGCPHCYTFEPALSKWLKNKPDNVQFIRQPAIFGKRWAPHAKAYFTAEVMGVVDKIHVDLFDAIQNKKQALQTEDDLAKFFAERGIDEKEFRKNFNSFFVDTKMRQAGAMGARYGLTGVPAVVINGKYQTGGSIPVVSYLVMKESLEKKQ